MLVSFAEEGCTCCVIPLRILIITSNDLDTEHRAKCKLILLCKGKSTNELPPPYTANFDCYDDMNISVFIFMEFEYDLSILMTKS